MKKLTTQMRNRAINCLADVTEVSVRQCELLMIGEPDDKHRTDIIEDIKISIVTLKVALEALAA